MRKRMTIEQAKEKLTPDQFDEWMDHGLEDAKEIRLEMANKETE